MLKFTTIYLIISKVITVTSLLLCYLTIGIIRTDTVGCIKIIFYIFFKIFTKLIIVMIFIIYKRKNEYKEKIIP